MHLVHHLSRPLERWAATSQMKARRNAMVAATELARRRAERLEVDEFLGARIPAPRRNVERATATHG